MLMSAKAFLDETPKPKDEMEIRRAMEGNLCRCTGYNAIIRAIDAVAKGNYREDKR
jgi:carbon-monoxide dehydrogenase small subunit